MKRNYFGWLLGLLILCVSVGYAGNHYVDKSKIYSIDFPDNWKVGQDTMEDGTQVAYSVSGAESDQDRYLENIVITTAPLNPKMSLDQFYLSNIKGLKEHFKDMVVEAEGKSTLDGVDAMWIRYIASIQNMKLKVVQYMFIVDNNFVIITYGSPVDSFDRFKERFEKSVSSIKFVKKK